jgi:malate dehydrogenase (oxaloacetate-decarboxylating)
MIEDGASSKEVANRIFVLDSRGLVESGRQDLSAEKRSVACPEEAFAGWEVDKRPISLRDVVRNVKATVLIGVSGVPGIFDEAVVTELCKHVERPIIMPLSNPTSHTEVQPADAIAWTGGRSLVATGSPFAPVSHDGRMHHIGQANNVFVFPGIGLGVLSVAARVVSDGMLLAASHALAGEVGDDLVAQGQLFPSVTSVRGVSYAVARAVAEHAIGEGVADPVDDVEATITHDRWYPEYLPYRPA